MSEEEKNKPAIPVHQKSKRRWLTIVLMLVIFVAGAAIGSGLTVICVIKHVKDTIANPNKAPQRIADAIKSKLSLSDQQDEKVREIVFRHHAAIMKLRCQWQPQMMAELEAARDEISQVLDEKQRKEWNEHFDRMRNTWLPAMPKTTEAQSAPACDDKK